jgi:aminoglycoside phosphotransferase (APT) family kinase protein
MTTLARRDDAELARGLTAWCANRWPEARYAIAGLDRPRSGWTNETLLVALRGEGLQGADQDRRLVVRLPPAVPTWPVYDLAAQARVIDALGRASIPVPEVVAYEADEQWLGVAFLVMSHAPGRPGAEVPALDPWVTDAAPETQRYMHEQFVDMLARIHRVDWRASDLAAGSVVRGGERSLAREVARWVDYVDWASDGAPTRALADAIDWCVATIPEAEPPASLCWGDARIGNVLFDDDRSITSVLDWEQATVGPAEMDLGWYLALDELTTHFVKQTVPGFLSRAEIIARYEAELGRRVVDLEWHEIFALVRSTAINDRQARLAAESGVPYPGVAGESNPVLRVIARRIDAFGRPTGGT